MWSVDGVPAAARALAGLEGGRIVILIAGAIPQLPGAYECAFLVSRAPGRPRRDPRRHRAADPHPNAGREGRTGWAGGSPTAGSTRAACKVQRVESGRVVLDDGELPFDLLLAVPPHRVPAVVAEAGLTGESGWVMVDRGTLATRFPGVYAVGDVTMIKLANGLPLPKAGLMAERQERALRRPSRRISPAGQARPVRR